MDFEWLIPFFFGLAWSWACAIIGVRMQKEAKK